MLPPPRHNILHRYHSSSSNYIFRPIYANSYTIQKQLCFLTHYANIKRCQLLPACWTYTWSAWSTGAGPDLCLRRVVDKRSCSLCAGHLQLPPLHGSREERREESARQKAAWGPEEEEAQPLCAPTSSPASFTNSSTAVPATAPVPVGVAAAVPAATAIPRPTAAPSALTVQQYSQYYTNGIASLILIMPRFLSSL